MACRARYLSCLTTAVVALLVAAAGNAGALETLKVTEGVYAFVGENSRRSPANLANNSTHGLIVTPDGVMLETDVNGRTDAFNPAELLLASLAACMIKGVEVQLHGIRQDKPPKMVAITYELTVDTDQSERRLALLHDNVRKSGPITNTIAEGTKLEGIIRGKA